MDELIRLLKRIGFCRSTSGEHDPLDLADGGLRLWLDLEKDSPGARAWRTETASDYLPHPNSKTENLKYFLIDLLRSRRATIIESGHTHRTHVVPFPAQFFPLLDTLGVTLARESESQGRLDLHHPNWIDGLWYLALATTQSGPDTIKVVPIRQATMILNEAIKANREMVL